MCNLLKLPQGKRADRVFTQLERIAIAVTKESSTRNSDFHCTRSAKDPTALPRLRKNNPNNSLSPERSPLISR